MKPSRSEHEALGRRPITETQWWRYEHAKQQWIADHPEATPQQYQAAMLRIALECGV